MRRAAAIAIATMVAVMTGVPAWATETAGDGGGDPFPAWLQWVLFLALAGVFFTIFRAASRRNRRDDDSDHSVSD